MPSLESSSAPAASKSSERRAAPSPNDVTWWLNTTRASSSKRPSRSTARTHSSWALPGLVRGRNRRCCSWRSRGRLGRTLSVVAPVSASTWSTTHGIQQRLVSLRYSACTPSTNSPGWKERGPESLSPAEDGVAPKRAGTAQAKRSTTRRGKGRSGAGERNGVAARSCPRGVATRRGVTGCCAAASGTIPECHAHRMLEGWERWK
mmetsp:Transcript_124848/g.347616  ORF Transcript_124848/g.347616 Transcript_124848/m.347616 type:complete len:205 (-) Transcript_124848:10-624(-)